MGETGNLHAHREIVGRHLLRHYVDAVRQRASEIHRFRRDLEQALRREVAPSTLGGDLGRVLPYRLRRIELRVEGARGRIELDETFSERLRLVVDGIPRAFSVILRRALNVEQSLLPGEIEKAEDDCPRVHQRGIFMNGKTENRRPVRLGEG